METEQTLIKKLVDFLNANGFHVWRQHNAGRFNQSKAAESLTRLVISLGQAYGAKAKANRPAILRRSRIPSVRRFTSRRIATAFLPF